MDKEVWLKFNDSGEYLTLESKILNIIDEYRYGKGRCKIILYITKTKTIKRLGAWGDLPKSTLDALKALIGEDAVRIVKRPQVSSGSIARIKQIMPCNVGMYALFENDDSHKNIRRKVLGFGLDSSGNIRPFIFYEEMGIDSEPENCCNFIGYEMEQNHDRDNN